MCFSAEASFAASTIIGLTGVLTLKRNPSRLLFFLAAIPVLFAIQQFAEGLLWLQLNHNWTRDQLYNYAKIIYLTFAFLIWPVWVPLSVLIPEKTLWRRNLIYLILACVITLSAINLFFALRQEISIQIIGHSLQYSGRLPSQTLIYPLIILLPCFISSLKNIWIFGLLIAMSYVTAHYFYSSAFVSVWCFFSAVVSLMIYKIIQNNSLALEENICAPIKVPTNNTTKN